MVILKYYVLYLKYTINNYVSIVTRYSEYLNIDITDKHQLIEDSNYNINNILVNMRYYKNQSNCIHKYDENRPIIQLSEGLVNNHYSINELYNIYYNDSSIIIYNLLDIIDNLLVNSNEKIITISNLYRSIINYTYYKEYNIFNYIIYPYFIINLYKSIYGINNPIIEYNKYISKNIICLTMNKYNHSEGYQLYNDYYNLIHYYQYINDSFYMEMIIDIIYRNNINYKLLHYYYKLYNYNKCTSIRFNEIIKKYKDIKINLNLNSKLK